MSLFSAPEHSVKLAHTVAKMTQIR